MFSRMLTPSIRAWAVFAFAVAALACAAEPDIPTLMGKAREATESGRLEEALKLWDQAAQAAQKSKNDVELRDSLTGRGEVEQALGRTDAAIESFRAMAAAHARIAGPQDVSMARTYDRIAHLYQESGKLAEALAEYEKAVTIREAALGRTAPEVAETLNNMGLAAYLQGDLDRAQKLLTEAVGGIDNQRMADSPNRAMALTNLAQVYRARGESDKAIELFREAVRVWTNNLGPDAERVALSQNNLAEALRTAGKLAEAEALYRSSLAILEKRTDAAPSMMVATLGELGVVLRRSGRASEAEPVMRRAIALQESTNEPNHSERGTLRFNLAVVLEDLGRPADAARTYEQAVEEFEAAGGADSAAVPKILERWAAAARKAGDTAKAEEIERRIAQRSGG